MVQSFLCLSIMLLFIMENNEFEHEISSFYEELIDGKKEYLKLFSRLQIQIEGWFRGELMNYLDGPDHNMTTENREVLLNDEGRKKADLKVEFHKKSYWVELKHLLVGYQKGNKKPEDKQGGNNFSLNFYFYSDTYITNDIEKLKNELKSSQETAYKYILAFVSTNYIDGKKIKTKKIESKGVLENQINEILNYKRKEDPLKNKACLISSDFNNDCNFGYFLLKIIV